MTTINDPALCPSCGEKLLQDARFCPQCGSQLASGDTLAFVAQPRGNLRAPEEEELSPTIHHVHRRVLGIELVPLACGAGALVFLLSLALFATGSIVGGFVLLALTLAIIALARSGVNREPDAEGARMALLATARVRARLRYAAVFVQAWSRAATVLVRLRLQRLRLERQLRDRLKPLGEAVHRDQPERAQAIKTQAEALEQALDENRREQSAALEAARAKVGRERAVSQATSSMPSQSPDAT